MNDEKKNKKRRLCHIFFCERKRKLIEIFVSKRFDEITIKIIETRTKSKSTNFAIQINQRLTIIRN